MNVWLLYIIIFLIGLLFFIIGVIARKRVARTIGITSMIVILVIAAVLLFVNGVKFIPSEVFGFLK